MKNISIELHDPVARHLFEGTNEKIEMWSKFIFTFFIKIAIPPAFLLNIPLTYYWYFTTDMGAEAFIVYNCFW